MSFENLFSGLNFASTIKKYCNEADWNISKLDKEVAVLKFSMNSGRRQTLYIIKYESTLEFSVPSMAAFDTEEDIPDILSTLLLKRNSEKKIGFWCIEMTGGKHVYSCMHNAEMQLINQTYFMKVVRALIKECDDFEETLEKML